MDDPDTDERSAAAGLAALGPLPVPVPIPLEGPGARATARRSAQLAGNLVREVAPVLVRRGLRRALRRPSGPKLNRELARPVRLLCEDMGATFLKYGQLVASAESVFGGEWAREFRSTLDTGPQVPLTEIRDRIESDLGRPVHELFRSLDPEPLGCASLAQVHRAVDAAGRTVAIKVLRPDIEARVAADLQIMTRVLPPLARFTGQPLDAIVDSLREQLSEELDLRNEARTMSFFRAAAATMGAGLERVHVPEPYPELSGRSVLTMEFLDGVPVDDLSAVESLGVDPTPIVEEVVKAWFLTALGAGVFHGDVHAGNIMILRDGRIAVLDWGIVGRLLDHDLHFFRQTIRGALGDDHAVEEVVDNLLEQWSPLIEAAADVDLAAVRQLMIATFGLPLKQPFGQVSLAELITAPQRDMEQLAADADTEVRSSKEQRKRVKESNFEIPDIDRSMILLAKQLAYFERYGKLYLHDIPLLHDEAFFGRLVGWVPGADTEGEPPKGGRPGRGDR